MIKPPGLARHGARAQSESETLWGEAWHHHGTHGPTGSLRETM